MSRRARIAAALAALPAAAGLLAAWLTFAAGWLPDRVVYTRISLGYLLLAAGLALSLLLGGALAVAAFERRRAAARLAQAQADAAERRRQFMRRLDHELKNPLTVLQVEAANLDAGLPAAEHAHSRARIHTQAARLNEMVVQLRKLAELETRPIEDEPVDLAGLLGELVAEVRQSLPEPRNLNLTISNVPWPPAHIHGDADLLYLAMRNVLTNAVKFTRPADSIEVRAFESDGYVNVEVADSGPGIPADEQPHVWDELFRGQAARSLPGSGLGLALVRAIVGRHGGQAGLRSRPGQGTVVTLRFPLHL